MIYRHMEILNVTIQDRSKYHVRFDLWSHEGLLYVRWPGKKNLVWLFLHLHFLFSSLILPDYAEPALTPIGHKVGSTFKPSSEECYTAPFTCSHYDTPGCLPEYAEPLPPEPEYATPFSDQPSDSSIIPAPTSSHSQYDCPSHRVLFNGYCTPALHANGPRPVSAVYAEPKSCDSLQQKHTYEDPLWAQQT